MRRINYYKIPIHKEATKMVSPELPESLEDDFYAMNVEHHLADPVVDSDDMDASLEEGHNGYQLLSTDDSIVMDHNSQQIYSQAIQSTSQQSDEQLGEVQVNKVEHPLENPTDTDRPSIEGEIVLEIWNKPRPQELDIDLDSTKTNQVNDCILEKP